MRQGRLKPSETSDGRNVKIHWDAATENGMALDYLCVIREGLTPYILCSAPGTDEELVGLSLAPVYHQYLPRRALSIKSSVDDPIPA